MERRLAAILAADVVGYTALMGVDEAGTLRRLTELRQSVLEPIIESHNGRVVKLMGDGLLVEFTSVVEAVSCALAWQTQTEAHQTGQNADGQLAFRIGINLGDVIVQGGDIHGDGVNIAARLETLAVPGGVCLSDDAYRQVRGKTDAQFEDLGEQQLKNVVEPVRVYRTVPAASDSAMSPVVEDKSQPSDKPSIAVLPFANMSRDAEQEYFSDGITEDIITELSRFRETVVIARSSSFAYRGRTVDMRKISSELGVDYVVEGSVRRAGTRVRVSAQLIEATSGKHLWADRYDRELLDVFEVQDEIARAIVGAIHGRVDLYGQQRALRLTGDGLRAYDLSLKGKALCLLYTKQKNAEARQLLQQAVALAPDNPQPLIWLAETYLVEANERWVRDYQASFDQANRLIRKAIQLDESDSYAQAFLGEWLCHLQDYGQAQVHLQKALELNPNNFHVHCSYGLFWTATGNPEQGLEHFETAKMLSPIDSSWVPTYRGIAYLTARRYGEAIDALTATHAPLDENFGWLAASYALNGQTDEAHRTMQEYLRRANANMAVVPRDLDEWREYWQWISAYQNASDLDHLMNGLTAAGIDR